MTNELKRVLHYKKFTKKFIEPKELYIDLFFDATRNIITTPIFTACPDSEDNYLFDLAYQSNADYLVSGDADVLNTPISPPLQLISFTQFKSLIMINS
jgi:putative PIN family toxin of toxin-antitoxin system